jgi:O-methyltransferase
VDLTSADTVARGVPGESHIEETLRVVARREGLTLRQWLTVVPLSWIVARPSLWELRHPGTFLTARRLCSELRRNAYTMLEVRRGRTLLALGREIERREVAGAIVDCGVWNGGSSVLMSNGAPSREVWMFDTFEGMPPPTDLDGEDAVKWIGEAKGTIDRVEECFTRYADGVRPHIVKGLFEDTLQEAAPSIGPIALLHIDADWYESMRFALETLYPLVERGGFIAVDDYGHRRFPGVKIAVDEFRASVRDSAKLVDNHFWRKPLD